MQAAQSIFLSQTVIQGTEAPEDDLRALIDLNVVVILGQSYLTFIDPDGDSWLVVAVSGKCFGLFCRDGCVLLPLM